MFRDLSAIVLAGGRSRRMGADKTSLFLGNRTLLERAVDLVAPLCSDVLVVAAEVPARPVRSARVVTDAVPNVGPLMGLYSGLQACATSRALVIAPDMPFLPVGLLEELARSSRRHDVVAARCGGDVQPLCAVYSTKLLPLIERSLAEGTRALRALFDRTSLRVRYVDERRLARWGDPRHLFWNVNTPHEFEVAKRLSLRAQASTARGPRRRADRVAPETVSPPVFGKEIHETPRSVRARDRLPAPIADRSL